MENNNVAMTSFREFLDANGWRYLADEDGEIRGLVSGDNGQRHWHAHLNADGRFLVFKSFCPVNVPARRRPAAAEYLMRANWGLNLGNFEMNWSDGQVCFRTSVTTGEWHPGSEILDHLLYGNHSIMERYLAGLLAVTLGGAAPAKAIAEAEKDLPPPPSEQTTQGSHGGEQSNDREPRQFSPDDN